MRSWIAKITKRMELNKGHIAFSIACFVAGAIIGAGLRSCSGNEHQEQPKPSVIHDTVTLWDTAYIAAKTKPTKPLTPDTIWVPVPADPSDCIDKADDSIAIEIPITQYEYRDTFTTDSSRIELGVSFSGYKARIEGIDLKSQYTIQPRTIVKKKGWGQFIGVGVGVGYGASVVGQTVYAAPEVGIHITYGWGYHW